MQEILHNTEGGEIVGYVANPDDEQLVNFFQNRKIAGSYALTQALMSAAEPVAFLCNVNVDESARGQGLGSALMDSFFVEAGHLGASITVLICDRSESQLEGFDLRAWYEGFGFEVADVSGHDEDFPVMVLDPDGILPESIFASKHTTAGLTARSA